MDLRWADVIEVAKEALDHLDLELHRAATAPEPGRARSQEYESVVSLKREQSHASLWSVKTGRGATKKGLQTDLNYC